jgi:hypothetical protein
MTPLPKSLKIAIHVLILAVTLVSALGQLPPIFDAFGLPNVAHYLMVVVTAAGVAVTYVLRSPGVIGWLNLHDPDDVIAAESARKILALDKRGRANTIPPPPMAVGALACLCLMLAMLACTPQAKSAAETVVVDLTNAICNPVDPLDQNPYVAFACTIAQTGEGLAATALTVQVPAAQVQSFAALHSATAVAARRGVR